MWQDLLARLHRSKPNTLCLVLGAETFRYTIAGTEIPPCAEPSKGNRWRDTDLIVAVGSECPTCRDWHLREWVPMFDHGAKVNARLLSYFCSGLCRQIGRRWKRGQMELWVTGRPDLMTVTAPLWEGVAEPDRFSPVHVVGERECLAMAAGDDGQAGLLVDVGHLGTRAYGPGGSEATGSGAASGRAMIRAVLAMMWERHGLAIGEVTALRFLQRLDAAARWPAEARGRDGATGLPRNVVVERAEIMESIAPVLKAIGDACADAMGTGPVQRVVMAGGCAQLGELRRAIAGRLGLAVDGLERPAEASLRGLCALAIRDAER